MLTPHPANENVAITVVSNVKIFILPSLVVTQYRQLVLLSHYQKSNKSLYANKKGSEFYCEYHCYLLLVNEWFAHLK